jgi:hypothetical protein
MLFIGILFCTNIFILKVSMQYFSIKNIGIQNHMIFVFIFLLKSTTTIISTILASTQGCIKNYLFGIIEIFL